MWFKVSPLRHAFHALMVATSSKCLSLYALPFLSPSLAKRYLISVLLRTRIGLPLPRSSPVANLSKNSWLADRSISSNLRRNARYGYEVSRPFDLALNVAYSLASCRR